MVKPFLGLGGTGSEQRAFIVEDLKALDRNRTPWLMVNGHRPMYVDSTYTGPPDSDQVVASELRDSLEDLFAAHAVDLTLHGHHHSYQRSCFVLSGKCIDLDAGICPSLNFLCLAFMSAQKRQPRRE